MSSSLAHGVCVSVHVLEFNAVNVHIERTSPLKRGLSCPGRSFLVWAHMCNAWSKVKSFHYRPALNHEAGKVIFVFHGEGPKLGAQGVRKQWVLGYLFALEVFDRL